MVGPETLDLVAEVRILPLQPICKVCVSRLAWGFAPRFGGLWNFTFSGYRRCFNVFKYLRGGHQC